MILNAGPQDKNRYLREIKPQTFVDVYDVLLAFKVADPMLQHIIKKALAAGQRGHKDFEQDIKDIYDSAKRAYEVHCVKTKTVTIDEEDIKYKWEEIYTDSNPIKLDFDNGLTLVNEKTKVD